MSKTPKQDDNEGNYRTPMSVFYRNKSQRQSKCRSFNKTHITQAKLDRQRKVKPK